MRGRIKTTRRLIYQVWHGMKRRCLDEKHKNYKHYGGRGINIYRYWLDFEIFLSWCLENGWSDKLQIDRIDNDGNYSPKNCRFVTCAVNIQNSTNAKITMELAKQIRIDFKTGISAGDISKKYGIKKSSTYRVIQNLSWVDPEYKYKVQTMKKLTENEKEEARLKFKEGSGLKSLSEEFQVNKSTMHYILHKREKVK